jgi:hypothetical protein
MRFCSKRELLNLGGDFGKTVKYVKNNYCKKIIGGVTA